jgi:hypothetical protein
MTALQFAFLKNPVTRTLALRSAIQAVIVRAEHISRSRHHGGLTLYHVRAGHPVTAYYSARRAAHHALVAREA